MTARCLLFVLLLAGCAQQPIPLAEADACRPGGTLPKHDISYCKDWDK